MAAMVSYVIEIINSTSDPQSSSQPEMTSSFTEAEQEEEGGGLVINWGARFVTYTVLAGACLLFNTVSLAALGHIRGPRTVHHRLLINLAVCDLVGTVLLWMYYNSPYIFPRQLTPLQKCLFKVFVLLVPVILSLCASSLALLMLAGNQYVAICSPLFAQTRITGGHAWVCIMTSWLVAAVAATLPTILMLSVSSIDERCASYIDDMTVKSLEICAYVLAGLILVIVVLYARIYREVLECRRRTNELRSSVHRAPTSRCDVAVCGRDSKTTRTVVVGGSGRSTAGARAGSAETNYKAFITTILLTGTLVVFWLPYMVFNLLSAHVSYDSFPDPVIYIKFYVTDFLPMLNFITDPIIYGIRMREIRQAYRRLAAAILPSRWFSEFSQQSLEQRRRFLANDDGNVSVAMTTRSSANHHRQQQPHHQQQQQRGLRHCQLNNSECSGASSV